MQEEADGHEETPHTNDTVSDMGAKAGSSSSIAVAMPNYIKDSIDVMDDGSLRESYIGNSYTTIGLSMAVNGDQYV